MKCSESHSTHLCSKPKTTPAKCSNFGGEHTSKAIFCPENPNNIKNKKTAVSTAETSKATPTSTISNDTPNLSQRPNPWFKNKQDNNNSNITQEINHNQNKNNSENIKSTKTDEAATAVGRLFLTFIELNPNQEQQNKFFKEANNLINILSKK